MQAYIFWLKRKKERKRSLTDWVTPAGVRVGLSLAFTMLSTVICLFYMNSQYDANQGNIQSHFLLSQRWMLERDGRSGNYTSCISHSILSLAANSEMCAYAAMLQCLWSSQPVYSIKQITLGPGNMTTNITIYSLILISVSTNHNISLMVLPPLHSAFASVFCLELRARRKNRNQKVH